jgi:hypothetical protein
MKTSKFTEEQIAFALRRVNGGRCYAERLGRIRRRHDLGLE